MNSNLFFFEWFTGYFYYKTTKKKKKKKKKNLIKFFFEMNYFKKFKFEFIIFSIITFILFFYLIYKFYKSDFNTNNKLNWNNICGGKLSTCFGCWYYGYNQKDINFQINFLKEKGFNFTFISLPFSTNLEIMNNVSNIIKEFNNAGIKVHWMTLQDPTFIDKQDNAVKLVQNIINFINNNSLPVVGIHSDCEAHGSYKPINESFPLWLELNKKIRKIINNSTIPLFFSQAVGWWYPKKTIEGDIFGGRGYELVNNELFDFVVPMIYDGTGETVDIIYDRTLGYLNDNAMVMSGIGFFELGNNTITLRNSSFNLQNKILKNSFYSQFFMGTSVFHNKIMENW